MSYRKVRIELGDAQGERRGILDGTDGGLRKRLTEITEPMNNLRCSERWDSIMQYEGRPADV